MVGAVQRLLGGVVIFTPSWCHSQAGVPGSGTRITGIGTKTAFFYLEGLISDGSLNGSDSTEWLPASAEGSHKMGRLEHFTLVQRITKPFWHIARWVYTSKMFFCKEKMKLP
jgi:hypothetical protein